MPVFTGVDALPAIAERVVVEPRLERSRQRPLAEYVDHLILSDHIETSGVLELFMAVVAACAEVLLTASIEPVAARMVFAALLFPGLVLVVAVCIAYSGPIWRFVRTR